MAVEPGDKNRASRDEVNCKNQTKDVKSRVQCLTKEWRMSSPADTKPESE